MIATLNRSALIRDVVFAVVERQFPDELQTLSTVWAYWKARISAAPQGSVPLTGVGLRALPPSESTGNSLLAILTMELLVPPDVAANWAPTQQDVDRASAEAARILQLSPSRMERARACVAPELRATLERHRDVASAGDSHRAKLLKEFVGGKVVERPRPSDLEAILKPDVDLIVDEVRAVFVSRKRNVPVDITDLPSQARRVLWLALEQVHWITLGQISGFLRIPNGNLETTRTAVSRTRASLTHLIGRDILKDGQGGMYMVRDDWSWRWIRVSTSPAGSPLAR